MPSLTPGKLYALRTDAGISKLFCCRDKSWERKYETPELDQQDTFLVLSAERKHYDQDRVQLDVGILLRGSIWWLRFHFGRYSDVAYFVEVTDDGQPTP